MPAVTTPRLLQIDRRNFVVGLTWDVRRLAESKSSRALLTEVRSVVRKDSNGQDLVVLRAPQGTQESGQFQYGFTRSVPGLSGAVAAAAVAADRNKGTWLGVFKVAEVGFWIIQVREDMITPQGDQFFEQETEAKSYFDIEKRRGRWAKVYAPEGWSQDAQYLPIEDLLRGASAPKLISASTTGDLLRVAGVAVIALAVAGIGVGLYVHHANVLHQQEEAARAARQAQELQARLRANQAIPVPAPWPALASSAAVLQSCTDGIKQIPMYVPGYSVAKVVCNGSSVSGQFSRTGAASPAWVQAWTSAHMPATETVSYNANGQGIVIQLPLAKLPPRGPQPLNHVDRVRRALQDWQIVAGSQMSLGAPQLQYPPNLTPEQRQRGNIPPAPWRIMHYTVTTDRGTTWAEVIGRVPGSVVQSVTYNPDQRVWTFEGDIYVLQ